ncbi:hypothetical protein IC757_03410 [Wenzhouxiangella sp. AB-CW3]|uniref:S1 family peptidase n=1 Tax=Wenzhouxiangella sp. AB-CW3 TaxID=2771012 RepID=UPI00168ABFD8|nr:S1 family peptidase [Wenzhouxiangella sp. AB-CW3]QOC23213.1 hypothetical protein IC757_03410 [Wenzhouxiangella sp. AB-CW3]
MAELLRLYQTDSEEVVIERLAAEAEAARAYGVARDLLGDAYAGAWFDVDRLTLVVAATSSSSDDLLTRLGVKSVRRERSQVQLLDVLDQLSEDIQRQGLWSDVVHSLHIDYPSNQVVVSVEPDREQVVQDLPMVRRESAAIRFKHGRGGSIPVSWPVRGGDKYVNENFSQQVGFEFGCSIGFSVEGGYLTAGHCGDIGHGVVGLNGLFQGVFDESEVGGQGNNDRASVNTGQYWNPEPLINGYNQGVLIVSSKWAGLQEAPLNTTVCRYGQASGGPHCGGITHTNVIEELQHNVTGQTFTVDGLTRTSACVYPGDSGGPFITPVENMAQGITISALDPSVHGPCPHDASLFAGATFDPVTGPLADFGKVMRTPHGANPPTIYGFNCPDAANSGGGFFSCEIDYFNSQGQTSMQWTGGSGNPSSGTLFFGTCNPHGWVTVDLQVSNDYGTAHESVVFACPAGPIP